MHGEQRISESANQRISESANQRITQHAARSTTEGLIKVNPHLVLLPILIPLTGAAVGLLIWQYPRVQRAWSAGALLTSFVASIAVVVDGPGRRAGGVSGGGLALAIWDYDGRRPAERDARTPIIPPVFLLCPCARLLSS